MIFQNFGFNQNYPIAAAGGIVTSGLLTYLDVGNTSSYPGSGSAWTDLSGNGYNATLVNTPTYSSSNGGYLDFNGTNQYATVYGFPGSTFSTSDFTIQFWSWYDTNYQTDGRCLLSQGTATNNGGLHLITRGTTWTYGMYNNDLISVATVPAGQWLFTTWTYKDSSPFTKQLYAQNALDKQENQNAYTGTANNTEIGRIGWSGFNGYYYDGRIAQMYIYNRILTSTEVTDNYNASKARYGL